MNKLKHFANKALSIVLLICLFVTSSGVSAFAATDPQIIEQLANTNIHFSYNETADAYKSTAFNNYFHSSPLGVAGNFCLVGFESVQINSDVDGNVLAKKIISNGHSFTSSVLPFDLSYAQEVEGGIQFKNNKDTYYFVLGSDNTITYNSNLYINNNAFNNVKNVIQDKDTTTAPFINLNTAKQAVDTFCAKLSNYSVNRNVDYNFSDMNNRYIQIQDPTAAAYFNITAKQLNEISGNKLELCGFVSGTNGSLIINVDCSSFNGELKLPQQVYTYFDGNQVSTGVTSDFSTGKVLWNFTNTDNTTIVAHDSVGSLIAPNANIVLEGGNVAGSVIGKNVNAKAEAHRRDFTGITDPTRMAIRGTKTVDGSAPNGKVFTFQLIDSKGAVIETKNTADGYFSFDNLEFKSKGIFTYTVVEKNDGASRILYDETEYTVTVDVRERSVKTGTSLYIASVSYSKNNAAVDSMTFNNSTIEVQPTSITLNGVKFLDGAAPTNGAFGFTLTETTEGATSQPIQTSNSNDGSFSFTINYEEAGEHTYTVKENIPTSTDNGIVYDNTVYSVAVIVTENADGTLRALTTIQKGTEQFFDGQGEMPALTFNNYNKVPVNLGGIKTYNNKTPGENRVFEFKLIDTATGKPVVDNAVSGSDGSFAFPQFYLGAGEYKYQIIEVNGGKTENGTIYDATVYNVAIEVKVDASGALKKEIAVTDKDGAAIENGIAFNNTSVLPEPTITQFKGIKTVNGGAKDSSGYTFRLYDTTNGKRDSIDEQTSDANGAFIFDEIEYKTEGSYTYEISEYYENAVSGIIYDETKYTAKVEVAKNSDNELYIKSKTINGNEYTDSSIQFNNKTEVGAQIAGTKTYDIAGGLTAGMFKFLLYSVGEDGRLTFVDDATNTADGSFAFDEIKYTEEKEYKYVVIEENGGRVIDGIYYDEAVFGAVVTIAQSIDGKYLTSNVKYGSASITKNANGEMYLNGSIEATSTASIKFENKSLKPCDVTLNGIKKVSGGTPAANEVYTFVLTETTDWNENKIEAIEARNTNGSFSFGPIEYTKEGVYTYTVTETEGTNSEILYDKTVYEVTVNVSADEDQLKASEPIIKTIENGNKKNVDGIVFNNVKEASVEFEGNKTFENASYTGTDYTFGLYNVDSEGKLVEPAIETVNTVTDGSFKFAALTYREAGTHEYAIKEIEGDNTANIAYDKDVYRITVKVEMVDGALVATETWSVNGSVITDTAKQLAKFNNMKKVFVDLEGTKLVVGGGNEIKAFSFELVDEKEKVLQVVQNDEEGKFSFAALSFSEAGTYNFKVREKTDIHDPDYQFDRNSVYDVTVVVTEENGRLSAVKTIKLNNVEKPIVFTNRLTDALPTETGFSGLKTVDGLAATDNIFSFSLIETTGDTERTIETVNNVGGAFAFNNVKYTSAGTYTYKIVENKGNNSNIVYDGTEYEITVVVDVVYTEVNGVETKTLAVTSKTVKTAGAAGEGTDYTDASVSFNNRNAATARINGVKSYNGGLEAEMFSFSLYEIVNGKEILKGTAKNAADGTFAFGPLYYTDTTETNHSYVVKEDNGGQVVNGVYYDDAEFFVTVNVKPDGNKLNAIVIYNDGKNVVFNNKDVQSIEVPLGGTKTENGVNYSGENYSFILDEVDANGNLITSSLRETNNVENGKFTFEKLTFSEAGKHYYRVSEIDKDADGIIYDTKKYDVTVEIIETAGVLSSNTVIKYASNSVTEIGFNNKTEVPVQFNVKKFVDGTQYSVGGYTFGLFADGETDALQTISTAENGVYSFAPLKYNAIGIHHYKIVELSGDTSLIDYDKTVYDITVEVTGDTTLTATTTISDGKTTKTINGSEVTLTFNNYNKVPVNLGGIKTYNNKTPGENRVFEFKLIDTATGKPVVDNAVSGSDGSFAFPQFYLGAGEYKYQIIEVNGGKTENGTIYDATVYNVAIEVKVDASGALKKEIAVTDKDGAAIENGIAFNNTSVLPEPTITQFKGIKTVNGGAKDSSGYTFRLYDTTNGKRDSIDEQTSDANGAFIFDEIEYKTEGSYTYEISEYYENAVSGIIYDETKYTAKVEVAKNSDNELYIKSKTINGNEYTDSSIQFNNKTEVGAQIAGTKTYDIAGGLTAGMFKFLLYSVGEDGRLTFVDDATNTADGSFAFDEIKYTEEKEYKYVVIEENGGRVIDGIYYDEAVFGAVVTIAQSIDGKYLTSNVKYGSASITKNANGEMYLNGSIEATSTASIKFENKSLKPCDVTLNGIKKVSGGTPAANEVYTFVLTETTDWNENKIEAIEARNTNGSFSFGPIEYTKEGVYTYTVTETEGTNSEILYDKTVYEVTVNVSADEDQLKASEPIIKTIENGNKKNVDGIVFNNVKEASVEFEGNKTFENASYTGTDYTFGLYNVDSEGKLVEPAIETVNTVTDGSFKFAALTYREAGTHEYAIKEIEGDNTANIAYDKDVYRITVKVEMVDGALVATETWSVNGSVITDTAKQLAKFNNMGTVSIPLEGKKTVDGKEPGNKVFTFELVDESGAVIQTVNNNTSGEFSFTPIVYSAEGDYSYKVREHVEIGDVGYNYDRTVYDVAISIEETNGKLSVESTNITLNKVKAPIVFENPTVKTTPTSTTFKGVKTLDGVAATENDYRFSLIETTGGTERTIETVNNDGGSFEFAPVNYTGAGTFTYKIVEEQLEGIASEVIERVAFDTKEYYVKVVVEEVTEVESEVTTKKLVIKSKTIMSSADDDNTTDDVVYTDTAIAFANFTKAAIELGGVKYFNNGKPISEKQFSFTLYKLEGTEETPIETVYNDADGNFNFTSLKFGEAGKTYNYVVKEDNGGTIDGGVYYDAKVYEVTVNVTLENSKLKAEKIVKLNDSTTEGIRFDNYSMMLASSFRVAGVSLSGIKTVNSQTTGIRAGQFRFELLMGGKVIATAENDADGNFAFRNVTLYKSGKYKAQIREVNGGKTLGGITYDATVFDVDITVDENGNITSSEVLNGENEVRFNNISTTKISVEKKWEDSDNIGGFRPESIEVALYADGVKTSTTQKLDETNGWFAEFTELPSTKADGTKIVYSIKETPVANYESEITIGRDDFGYTRFTLTNTLSDSIAVSVDPIVNKRYEGATLQTGQFEFILYSETNADGSPIVLDRQSNLANGHIIFNPLFFTSEGTYEYTMKEVVDNPDPRITYDTEGITAKIEITRNSDGALEAAITYYDNGEVTQTPEFVNSYVPINLRVQKTSRDSNKTPLIGAIYALYRVNENGDNDIFIGQSESGSDGYMLFEDVQPGYWYYFREVKSPAGYVVDPFPTEPFLVNADGTLTYESAVAPEANPSNSGSAAGSSNSSAAAKTEQVKQGEAMTALSETNEAVVKNLDSNENSAFEIVPLETVTFDAGVSDPPTTLTVGKLDTDTNQYVAGAEMQIIERDTNKLVYSWTTDGSAKNIVGLLNVNTYYIIREVKAPAGYDRAADTVVYLEKYGSLEEVNGASASQAVSQSINIYDTKLASIRYNYIIRRGARTDDASGLGLQVSLIAMVISFVAIVALILLKVKLRARTKKSEVE